MGTRGRLQGGHEAVVINVCLSLFDLHSTNPISPVALHRQVQPLQLPRDPPRYFPHSTTRLLLKFTYKPEVYMIVHAQPLFKFAGTISKSRTDANAPVNSGRRCILRF